MIRMSVGRRSNVMDEDINRAECAMGVIVDLDQTALEVRGTYYF